MELKHWLNYQETEMSFEPVIGVSETVPDQSYTIRDLLERFASGTMPPVGQDGYYDDETEVDNWITDPTLKPDFDLADYTIETLKLQEQRFLRQTSIDDVTKDVLPPQGTKQPSAGNQEVPPTD